jgi:hypothetical protein
VKKATEQVVMEEVGSLPGSNLGGGIDCSDGYSSVISGCRLEADENCAASSG